MRRAGAGLMKVWTGMTKPEMEAPVQAAGPGTTSAPTVGGAGSPGAGGKVAPGQPPWWRPFAHVHHLGWSWTVGRDWLVPSSIAVSTLFLGAALGGVPALVAGSWRDPQTRLAVWATAALGAIGLLALFTTRLIWRGRNGMLRRNGTAYIIRESAQGWSADDVRVFLASARRQFTRTIEVPGPGKLGGSWDWPLEGARRWDAKVTELVRAFQALRFDDDPATPKGVFMWAWAPVAIAFGARVTAADRGLVLDIWQRPSRGRSGTVEVAPWSQRPHRIGPGRSARAAVQIPDDAPCEHRWLADVMIRPSTAAEAAQHGAVRRGKAPVILLVRLGGQSWGPVPDVPAEPDPAAPLHVVLRDAAGLGLCGTFRTDIRELRLLPADGGKMFPWAVYPALVQSVGAWIRRQADDVGTCHVMIGLIIPPEVALGLGIDAARPAGPAWPTNLWPLVYRSRSEDFVVPRLNLGSAAYSEPAE